ncbi:MAG: lysophospholipid acyltransferase family protein [Chthoniobacteraceae bacterium]
MNKEAILSLIGSWLVRALGATLRFETDDRAGFFALAKKGPCLFVFWHNRILAVPSYYERVCRRDPPMVVLTSASRDGGLLAAFVKRFGVDSVRGSSSKRGAAALLQLTAELERGMGVIITPDGPRGPRYVLGPGVIFLSQKTGTPILPIQVVYSRYWELKSWDRFRIPKPFSRVRMILHPFHQVPAELDDAGFEAERARLETVLRAGEAPGTSAKASRKKK